jgi:hypothetical protein
MTGPRSAPLLPLGALASVALAACGGGGGGAGGGDGGGDEVEPALARATEAGLTSGKPSKCTLYFTPAYNEQTHFASGPVATSLCIRDAAATAAGSVEVTSTEVHGDEATAEAVVSEGPLGDQSLSLELLRESERWRIDRLAGFADFDRESFDATIARGSPESPDGSPRFAHCLVDSLGELSDEEVEDLYVSGDPDRYAPLLAPCFQAAG